jgi:hypothetical protein
MHGHSIGDLRISSWSEIYLEHLPIQFLSLFMKYKENSMTTGSWDSAVSIETGYELDGRGVGVWVPVGAKMFFSPRHPDQLWGWSSLLSNGYRGLINRGLSGRCVKLTTHIRIVRGEEYVNLHIHSTLRLQGPIFLYIYKRYTRYCLWTR